MQAKRKMLLNQKNVEALSPQEKHYIVWDASLPGFGCRVNPKGRKVYIYKYYNLEKKQVWLSLGKHGLFTSKMARQKVNDIIQQISKGVDPQKEKQLKEEDDKASILFKDFWKIFDEKYIQNHHKVGTIKRNKYRINNYILPFFGNMKLKNIEYEDVMKFMDLPALRKVQITAARSLALLSPAFKHAELWGYRPKGSNPCVGVPKKATGKKERFLTDMERDRLETILLDHTLHKGHSIYAVSAILMLMYTGCRRSEITTLKWEDVHLQDKYLYFKDSKTGTKTVPLNPKAIAVLESLERKNFNPYVFCGKYPRTHIQEIRKAWEKIRKLADLEDVRLHDLRHSFASFALKQGVDLYTVSKLLGHKNIATTTRYAHLELEHLKEATNKIFG
jgi:integrase